MTHEEMRVKLIIDLGSEHTNEKVAAMAEKVRDIFAYRAEIAENIMWNKHKGDPEINSVLSHMIEHYNDIIRDILAL